MRDCRGSSFMLVGFKSVINIPESKLLQIEAPLLCCDEIKKEASQKQNITSNAFIPLCPFQESFKATLFSCTELHLKISNTNILLLIVQDTTDRELQTIYINYTLEVSASFVGPSSFPPKTFNSKRNKVQGLNRRVRRSTSSTCRVMAQWMHSEEDKVLMLLRPFARPRRKVHIENYAVWPPQVKETHLEGDRRHSKILVEKNTAALSVTIQKFLGMITCLWTRLTAENSKSL